MREQLPELLEAGRVRWDEKYVSARGDRYGAFELHGPCGVRLMILSSGEAHKTNEGWEHVSISTKRRIPNWTEMSFVKALFWGDEECVIQLHVPKGNHINNHPFVLHLWKPPVEQPMPPDWMV